MILAVKTVNDCHIYNQFFDELQIWLTTSCSHLVQHLYQNIVPGDLYNSPGLLVPCLFVLPAGLRMVKVTQVAETLSW